MKNIKYIAAAFLVSGILSAQNIDLNAMPKPGPTPTVNVAQPKTFTLKNGLTVMVVENNKLPRVNVTLTIDTPPVYEGDIAGVSNIMASQLGNGTTSLSKEEFNKKVDFLGARLNFGASGAFANTLSKYYPEVVSLMADAIINPKFSSEEVQKSKERALEGLKADEKSAEAIANRVSDALIYGKNTALGEFKTAESINKIQLKDVQDFYQKYYTPNNAYLVIVGDVKYDEVKKQIENQFKNWKKSNVKIPTPAPAKNLTTTEVNVVDVPNAVQSIIKVGNVSTLQMKDPQYFAGVMANYILGGGGEGRLFMNLREKNAFTYGAYSSLSTSKYSPNFSAEASVRNEVTDKAVKEFINELNAISTVKPEELQNAKAKLKGNFIMSLEKPETIARFALNQKLQNLPADFYTNYLKSIEKVTAADIKKVVNENILPNQARIFIAGKATDIADSLEKLGYPVKYYDAYANPSQKPEVKKVDANVNVESVAQNYIKAIGGKEAVSKINSVTMNATATVQGMPLEMTLVQAKGGKMMMDMKMMGNSMQKVVFDGKDGYIMAQGNKIPMPEQAKQEMQKSTEVFKELAFANNGNYELKGIEKVNNEDAYAIKSGKTTYFYSVKSGLKLGETKVEKMGDKEMTIPSTFSDYKEVSGVKMPFKINQNMSGMDITFEVKSYEFNKAQETDFK
ncbi:insulinase family protein [Riemerella anatipestifer]|uniref:M16 family metallopeptidase n=1 Tax=Riemerella anatipestifer TaxID=34085 RepID=UPI0013727B6F|nr:pitrilysin family protein [Riemerella anatipestifer]MBT0549631.1 insulinase family protein [Riemerella anatipestifer]MBT0556594.1 insulinase family protein [Riemerella anatipestifer]MBT0560341.1 insulinase family protein [Riemerella anatipestifer]MDY3524698.1 pitrilysin family protein [Riemerella anatipestifer]NAV16788.1 insulinase family protein [Riemerella anatipestifer]